MMANERKNEEEAADNNGNDDDTEGELFFPRSLLFISTFFSLATRTHARTRFFPA